MVLCVHLPVARGWKLMGPRDRYYSLLTGTPLVPWRPWGLLDWVWGQGMREGSHQERLSTGGAEACLCGYLLTCSHRSLSTGAQVIRNAEWYTWCPAEDVPHREPWPWAGSREAGKSLCLWGGVLLGPTPCSLQEPKGNGFFDLLFVFSATS